MTVLVPALGGAMVVVGLLGIVIGLRPAPVQTGHVARPERPPRATGVRAAAARVQRLGPRSPRMRLLWAGGLVGGMVTALLTGWLIAILVVPAAIAGLPVLLSKPAGVARIDRLEAMEEWARGLSGVLVAGLGLDDALKRSLRSTPEAIRPEVRRLVSRLHAGMPTDRALRAFADDLDDATGDLIAANLILASTRRGSGLAAVLNGLASSVGDDVRARRRIDADQAGPRSTARQVSVFTVVVLAVLALTGQYIEPYSTPVGQVILLVLLTAYVATLMWLRAMATPAPLPRFLGASVEVADRGANPRRLEPATGSRRGNVARGERS